MDDFNPNFRRNVNPRLIAKKGEKVRGRRIDNHGDRTVQQPTGSIVPVPFGCRVSSQKRPVNSGEPGRPPDTKEDITLAIQSGRNIRNPVQIGQTVFQVVLRFDFVEFFQQFVSV